MVRSIEGKHPNYYEAILQLRDVSSAVMDFVYAEIDRGRVHISKEEEAEKGVDIYLSDSNFTKALGRKLQEQFGGEHKSSASLFGQKDGKEIYRLTVLFRGIPFRKDNVVEYGGERYQVKIVSKDILLQNSKTGEKVHVKYKDMNKIKAVNL